jgi:hypothetical protein
MENQTLEYEALIHSFVHVVTIVGCNTQTRAKIEEAK